AAFGLLLLPRALDPQSRAVFGVLPAALVVAAVALALVARGLPVRRLPYRVRRLLAKIRRSVRAVRSRPERIAEALAMGVSLQLLLVLLQAGLGSVVGLEIPLTAWLFAWPMAKLSALLPVTQGGLGVREAALAGLLAPFGVEPVLAVAAGLAFQGVIISGGLVGGAIAYLLARVQDER
ncbi:MAG: flippase-like domain-containing protein, partial [Gemmatimonadetes bacterium]|nr:flippase-like domain-containing protein [Gemmatimonadota bacterium]